MQCRKQQPTVNLSTETNDGRQDTDLVMAARAGSKDAFETLQTRYQPRLYRRLLSITRNHEDAEDALQDTFLRAYAGLAKFEGRAQFSSWLTQIATNSALMILRKRRIRGDLRPGWHFEAADDNSIPEVLDSALNPEQICDQRQRCAAVLRAIQKLDPKMQTALQLRIIEEYSIKEVAENLNASVVAAKSRLHRARLVLRRYLELEGRVASAAQPGTSSSFMANRSPNDSDTCPVTLLKQLYEVLNGK
jgi:RNA polymerase sigma-70 factor, ECF subfamily